MPGSYTMVAPWKVVAVAATLVQASGMGSEERDSEVWGSGGAGCLQGEGGPKDGPLSVVALRWGASPKAYVDGDVPLWLSPQGAYVDDMDTSWLARDCGQELSIRVLPQTTPAGVSSLLSAVNRDS